MLKLAFLNLFRRKSRTLLSFIGIAIGVAAIISLVSVVDGTYAEFNSLVSQFQGILVMEKDSIDQMHSSLDASLKHELEKIPGVRTVVSEIWLMPKSVDGKELSLKSGLSKITFVYGADMKEYNKLKGNGWLGEMYKGEMLSQNDTGQVVIGKKLFDDMDKFIGTVLKINGKNFKIKGVLKTESDYLGNIILLNLSDARELSNFDATKVSSYYVELLNPKDDKKISELIEFKFGEQVKAHTAASYSQEFGGVLENFRLVVFIIAGLSAIVAAIGIINTILMSVMERRREIGTLKATGWSDESIMKMILYESLFIGLFGGIVGLALGFLISFILEGIGLNPLITIELVLEAYVFAVVLGLLAGIYPAIRALRMSPVEAMR